MRQQRLGKTELMQHREAGGLQQEASAYGQLLRRALEQRNIMPRSREKDRRRWSGGAGADDGDSQRRRLHVVSSHRAGLAKARNQACKIAFYRS